MSDQLLPGLCSVTFRTLDVDAVARLAGESGLVAIEWGADVHVPPGDAAAISRARAASAGCEQVSYGSYLLAAGEAIGDDEIALVLDTACELGAPNVRVWTPLGAAPGTSRTPAIVDRLRAIAAAAEQRSQTVGLEFHGDTLTQTAASAAAVVDAVGATNLSTYWQPPYWLPARPVADDVADIQALGHRLSHLHVYEWTSAPDIERRPLVEGTARWQAALRALPSSVRPRVAWLEFVAGDDPAALGADAAALRSWIEERT